MDADPSARTPRCNGDTMTFATLKAVHTTYTVVISNLATVIRIAWLPAAVYAVANGWFQLVLLDVQDALLSLPDDATPELQAEAIAPLAGPLVPLFLVMALASVVFSAGFLKWILRGEEPGIAYADFGADELRLIASWALVAVLLAAVGLGAGAAAGSIVGIVRLVAPGLATPMAEILAGAVLVVIAYVAARLSLVGAIVIRDEKWGISAAWALTKDNGWRLLAFWVLVGGPVYALNILLPGLFVPGYFESLGQGGENQNEFSVLLRENLTALSAAGYLLSIPTWALTGSAAGVALRVLTGQGIVGSSRADTPAQ